VNDLPRNFPPLAVLDVLVERIELQRLRIYEIAEEAAMMPLDQLITYLEALQSTDGKGIPKKEWAQLKKNIDALRCLAEPLRTLARVYSRLEVEHFDAKEKKRKRPS
jgi:hypothetical protein